MFGHVFEVKRGPRLIPVNESMVWIDYQPFLDTFFKDLGRDLSSDKNRESYAYSNFSIIEFVMIGSKSSDYGKEYSSLASTKWENITIDEDVVEKLKSFVPEHLFLNNMTHTHVKRIQISQPLLKGSRMLAKFHPCEELKDSVMVLGSKSNDDDETHLPMLIIKFEEFNGQWYCHNGKLSFTDETEHLQVLNYVFSLFTGFFSDLFNMGDYLNFVRKNKKVHNFSLKLGVTHWGITMGDNFFRKSLKFQ